MPSEPDISHDRGAERDAEGVSIPGAKRSEREGTDPHAQPGEFADEMHTNRFREPPPPK